MSGKGKIVQMKNRKLNLIEKIGAVGLLICGAGVGGPDSLKCLGLAIMFILVIAVGYSLQERSERHKTAKKVKQRTKDANF